MCRCSLRAVNIFQEVVCQNPGDFIIEKSCALDGFPNHLWVVEVLLLLLLFGTLLFLISSIMGFSLLWNMSGLMKINSERLSNTIQHYSTIMYTWLNTIWQYPDTIWQYLTTTCYYLILLNTICNYSYSIEHYWIVFRHEWNQYQSKNNIP